MGVTRTGSLVLDTSAYSHFRRGHTETLDCMARAQTILLPTIVLGELYAGFELGSRLKANLRGLRDFLDEPFTVVAPVTDSVAQRYGKVFAELKRAGTPLPISDVWIAATTFDEAAHLLTFDRDFECVPGLEVTVLG